jgi:hypothetical protein
MLLAEYVLPAFCVNSSLISFYDSFKRPKLQIFREIPLVLRHKNAEKTKREDAEAQRKYF